ncbi:hypothetical protein F0562_026299 [Nyssa sinensis]|uniref:Uncharacterized protein n=1 Tax=Nyssa sinensis TaxID=561372 RepID=A0A5J5BD05_9ASTE|nr:hypothetical protein F0562_026299 [Nyssa sinensis]
MVEESRRRGVGEGATRARRWLAAWWGCADLAGGGWRHDGVGDGDVRWCDGGDGVTAGYGGDVEGLRDGEVRQ